MQIQDLIRQLTQLASEVGPTTEVTIACRTDGDFKSDVNPIEYVDTCDGCDRVHIITYGIGK